MKPNKREGDKGSEKSEESVPMPSPNPEVGGEESEEKEPELNDIPEPGVEGEEGSGGGYGRPREDNEDEGKHV